MILNGPQNGKDKVKNVLVFLIFFFCCLFVGATLDNLVDLNLNGKRKAGKQTNRQAVSNSSLVRSKAKFAIKNSNYQHFLGYAYICTFICEYISMSHVLAVCIAYILLFYILPVSSLHFFLLKFIRPVLLYSLLCKVRHEMETFFLCLQYVFAQVFIVHSPKHLVSTNIILY